MDSITQNSEHIINMKGKGDCINPIPRSPGVGVGRTHSERQECMNSKSAGYS